MTDCTPNEGAPYALRHPRPGDMGWVLERHGAMSHGYVSGAFPRAHVDALV
jgi:hypothetical protein